MSQQTGTKKMKVWGNIAYIFSAAFLIAAMIFNALPAGSALAAPNQDLQLNLSHVQCVDGQVEIHFVLLNVPDGVTPGTLSYTYGSITPGSHTGNVWHFFDYKPSGTFNITSASVDVDGTTVSLHNPGDYAGTYDCGTATTETPTVTETPTETPTETSTQTPDDRMVTICHAAGQDDTIQYVVLTLNYHAVFNDNGGHFYENGTPQAGHENDFVIETEEDLARCQGATETPVPDPFSLEFYCMGFTVTNLNQGEASFDWEVAGGPSGSETLGVGESINIDVDPSFAGAQVTISFGEEGSMSGFLPEDCATPTEMLGLQVTGFCMGPNAENFGWRVTNPNPFDVDFEWRVNGSLLAGLATVGAGSTYDFSTAKSEGNIVMVYVGGEVQDDASGVETCQVETETPPPPTEFDPTLPPPTGGGGGGPTILIPVTGVSGDAPNMTPRIFLNVGLGLFGLGLVLTGLSRRQH